MRYLRESVLYLSIPESRTMRKVMLDPLTTSICDIPEVLKLSCISRLMSSTSPIVIPRMTPAISRGNPRNICNSVQLLTRSRSHGSHLDIVWNEDTSIFPDTAWKRLYFSNPSTLPEKSGWIFHLMVIMSQTHRVRFSGTSMSIESHDRSPTSTIPVDTVAIESTWSLYACVSSPR